MRRRSRNSFRRSGCEGCAFPPWRTATRVHAAVAPPAARQRLLSEAAAGDGDPVGRWRSASSFPEYPAATVRSKPRRAVLARDAQVRRVPPWTASLSSADVYLWTALGGGLIMSI